VIYELNHVGAFVRDGDASVRFYTDVLGAQLVREALIPSSNTRCLYLQLGSGLIELLAPGDPSSRSEYGFAHVAFMTDDLDGDHRRLVEAGYTFNVAPKVAGSGDGRLAFLSDPNGVSVELLERKGSFRTTPVDGPVRSFDHISLLARDLASAEGFYRERMGMDLLKRMRVDARDLDMVYLNRDLDVIELLRPASAPADAPLIGHIAMRVDSVDAMVDELRTQGVTLDPGSPKNAGTGHGRIATFTDADGIKIELLDRPDLRDL
jgi:catechol 2,3-dioxygenase-like lactoylglutathione lyase family enzyme